VGLGIAAPSASLVSVLAVLGVLSGCGGAGNSVRSDSPPVHVNNKAADDGSSQRISPRDLRLYLSAWETSWRRLGNDLESGDEGALGFSPTPDASWERARRLYDGAASAYRQDGRRLSVLAPPTAMRKGHGAYLAAIRRQAARFQTLADAFGGSDPQAMERALEALQTSQMKFDLDGARWEQAVITACKASGIEVPEIVRLELISNHQRTKAG
jgi:hypothetical protein